MLSMLRSRSAVPTGAAVLLISLGLTACGSASSAGGSDAPVLTVTDAWVKASQGPMTGAFGVIANPGTADVTITGASVPNVGMVELHETVMVDGQMQMQPKQGGFVVPAGGSLTLEPGGNHIMLLGMTAPINPGASVPITLSLSTGGTVVVEAIAKDFAGGNESYQPSASSMG